MLILIDMDGVIADFESGFVRVWQEQHPDKPVIALPDRRTFRLTDQYPAEDRDLVVSILGGEGFYRDLLPIPGGLAALQEMKAAGHEIFICTTPYDIYQNCVREKYEWVEHYLGIDWVNRIVLTKDKTLVTGDILIDDNPEIRGVCVPAWEHILYDQPYNQAQTTKRRITWQTWQEVLQPEQL